MACRLSSFRLIGVALKPVKLTSAITFYGIGPSGYLNPLQSRRNCPKKKAKSELVKIRFTDPVMFPVAIRDGSIYAVYGNDHVAALD